MKCFSRMKFGACLFMVVAILVECNREIGNSVTTNLWKEGKVPYEISSQFSK